MFRLSLLLLEIALSVFFLAHPSRGVRSCPTIQEENGSLARGLLHDPPKRRLTSLKSNTNQTILYGQDSNSWDVEYVAILNTYSGGPDDNYYGLLATLDVYGHELQRGQKSSTAILISNVNGDGARSSLTKIHTGWHIYPDLYGDSRPHFYTYWTRDGDQTGCYNNNMDCPGFVPAKGATVAPGALIDPVSDAKTGRIQYITLKVLKDKSSGDWWVYYGFNSVPTAVGYYPRSLFTYSPDYIAFGAFVDNQRTLPTPPMGSGVHPNAGQGRAASFTGLYLVDQDGKSNPIMGDLPSTVDNGDCYSITPVASAECFYGGPGGCVY